jgi:hypothetical protein
LDEVERLMTKGPTSTLLEVEGVSWGNRATWVLRRGIQGLDLAVIVFGSVYVYQWWTDKSAPIKVTIGGGEAAPTVATPPTPVTAPEGSKSPEELLKAATAKKDGKK